MYTEVDKDARHIAERSGKVILVIERTNGTFDYIVKGEPLPEGAHVVKEHDGSRKKK